MNANPTPLSATSAAEPRALRFDCPTDAVFGVLERLSSLARRGNLRLRDLRIEPAVGDDALAIVHLSIGVGGAPHDSADPGGEGPLDVFVARLAGLVDVGGLIAAATPRLRAA